MHESSKKRNAKNGLNHKNGHDAQETRQSPENAKVSYATYFNMAQRRAHIIRMFKDKRFGLAAKAIGAYLMEVRINAKTGLGWETMEHIAERTASSDSTVKRAVRALLKYGYLVLVSRGSFNGKKANEYGFPSSIKDAQAQVTDDLPRGSPDDIRVTDDLSEGSRVTCGTGHRRPVAGVTGDTPTDNRTDTRTDTRTDNITAKLARDSVFQEKEERHGAKEDSDSYHGVTPTDHGADPTNHGAPDLEMGHPRETGATAARSSSPPNPRPRRSRDYANANAIYLHDMMASFFKNHYEQLGPDRPSEMREIPTDLDRIYDWSIRSCDDCNYCCRFVNRRLSEANRDKKPILTAKYFETALYPDGLPIETPEQVEQRFWDSHMEYHRITWQWMDSARLGSPPGEPGCKVPDECLARHGFPVPNQSKKEGK